MFRTALLTFVTLNVAFKLGQAEDQDCLPPHEGGPHMHGEHECCSAPSAFGEDDIHETIHKCQEESGMKHERGSGPPPKPDDKVVDCMEECMFKSMGYAKDGALDKEALKAKITAAYTGEWAAVALQAFEKCFASAPGKVSQTSTCKSGAKQFLQCFTREAFLNCPGDNWTESDQCTQHKAIFEKCENKSAMFIMGGKPGGHGHGPPHHH